MGAGNDLGSVVEAAYEASSSDQAWLSGLLDRVRGQLHDAVSETSFAMTFDVRPSGAWAPDVVVGINANLEGVLRRYCEVMPAQLRQRYAGSGLVGGRMSGILGVTLPDVPELALVAAHGGVDSLSIHALNPNGSGCAVGVTVPRRLTPSRRFDDRWKRVAIHIAAGLRLRHADDFEPEAMLTPDGHVSHAEPAAQSSEARGLLQAAAVAIDRARCSTDWIDLLTVWEGLVAGCWSLVDRFDSDGRRFLVARRNDPAVREHVALTLRERRVVALAACGHTDKYIAYALGIGRSSVATHIASARGKLGCRSRVELVALGAKLGATGRRPDTDA
jgi:DNA-binding CsgD family transcriptional regulator